jgi:DNA-binding transcriptional LysR family regulator
MVEGNEIDIGIVEGPVGNKNLVSKVCWDDELVVVTPPGHELTKSDSVSVEQIFEYPFISREEGSGTREVIQDHLQASGRDFSDLNLIMEFGSPESIKSAVAAGLGISILSIATLNKELELGLLAKASLASPLKRPFSIVYQRQKFRLRAMDEFLEFTEAHCVQKQANA